MQLQKDKIVLLVGASGTGKTSVAKVLEQDGHNIIHSFTTRSPREDNEWGHTFVDSLPTKKVNIEENGEYSTMDIIDKDSMIAHFHGYDVHYWATKEQYQGKGISIYVIDPTGAQEVHNVVKDAEVITIYLMADRKNRMTRMIFDQRDYKDIQNRLVKDDKIFSVCKCDYVVDANGELNDIVDTVKNIIENGGV